MTEIDQIKRPAALLSELPDSEVPGYLYPLVLTARMISNFAIYDDEASNLTRALRIIEQARKELRHAEQKCQEQV